MLRKDKPCIDLIGSWRPIALLNTIGKLIKAELASKLQHAAVTHNLLPPEQIGNRPSRSTETALHLIVSAVKHV